jgi:hypothetical protein
MRATLPERLALHRKREEVRDVCFHPPNGLSLSCTARAHVPKPPRRGGCRQGVAKPRLAICNCRDAPHSSVLTSRLGRIGINLSGIMRK